MKIHLPLLVLGVTLAPHAQAQEKAKSKVVTGKINQKVVRVDKTPSVVRKVGEIVRFKIWAEGLVKPKYSNQMNDSSPYKPFGTLRLDGAMYWNKPRPDRKYASSWMAGLDEGVVYNQEQRFEISSDTKHTNGRNFDIGLGYDEMRDFKISLLLYSLEVDGTGGRNTPPERAREIQERNDYNYAHPPLMGSFDLKLDLSKKGNYLWTWSDGDRKGSKLHLSLERVGFLYKANVPQVGPVIEKPDLPARLPGPGPVSKVTRPRIQNQTKKR